MAVRKHLTHTDKVRARIQVSQLVNLLQNHGLKGKPEEISKSRMKAIEILLSKSLPSLNSVTHEGPDGGPLHISISDSEL